jgi:hypothetical protein
MKKLTLLLILSIGFNYVHSQWSVKLYKNRDFLLTNSSNDQITVLEMDNQKNIWFNLYNGWGGGGLVKFTGEKWICFNNTIFQQMKLSPTVNAIAFDLADSVWIGTDNGLAQFNGISQEGWKIYNAGNDPILENKITAIAVDNKNIKYIGFNNGSLAAFDGYTWNIFKEFPGTGNTINDLEKDLEGNIWIARIGDPGLLKFRDGTFTPIPGLADIRNIAINPNNGQVYVTSKDKLIILENDKIIETVQPDALLGCELYEVEFHPDGPFVSTNKGLLKKSGSTFELVSKSNSALPDLVPRINSYSVPLVYDAQKLWFSFVYEGVSASYGSIGYLEVLPMVPPPITSLDNLTNQFCYGESITLDANFDGADYIWDGIISARKTFTVYDTKTIQLTVMFKEVCGLTDTIKVEVNDVWIDSVVCLDLSRGYYNTSTTVLAQHVFEDEEIGVVTCDPVIDKNLVVWKKTPDKGTEYYNVYKMLSLNDSLLLGSVNYNDLTVFTDTTSHPKQQSDRYVITTVDTCGNESYLSSVHKTMHLAASPGTGDQVNLVWEHYEGIPVNWYYIYRGTDSTAMELIDSVDYYSGKTQYTDENPPSYKVYYAIGVKLPEPIMLTTGKKADSGPYSQSMSNLEDNRFLVSVNDPRSREIISYPNPFSQWTQIDFENPMKQPYQLIITDMSGKIVKVIKDIRDNKVVVLRSDLPQGFYLFELKGDMVYRGKFVIE